MGNTEALARGDFWPVRIRGVEPPPNAGSPQPRIDVIEAEAPANKPTATPDPPLANPSAWHTERNKTYGVTVAFPGELLHDEGSLVQPWFARQDGTETILSTGLPEPYLPGFFTVSVNTKIDNSETCDRFESEPVPRAATIHGIRYAVYEGGGVGLRDYVYHTFQNNLCYEFHITRQSAEGVHFDFIRTLLSRVSFARPQIARPVKNVPPPKPEVTSFTAAQGPPNPMIAALWRTELSWTTRNADYVELSYACSKRVVILEDQTPRTCRGDPIFHDAVRNHSPDASAMLGLKALDLDASEVPVVVTLVPFSHGTPYPEYGKSLTVSVPRWNPFPEGIHVVKKNIQIGLSPSDQPGTLSYHHGSSVEVTWNDSLSRDSCVNVWLVRDGPGGVENFVSRVAHKCVPPARSGRYVWTVPGELSGSGFRVYVAAPGNTSMAVSEPFAIAP
ncbi:MAG: hypothetical protein WA005_06140 [Candidatus Binataceae bacterium]